jgi:hypothetical protein
MKNTSRSGPNWNDRFTAQLASDQVAQNIFKRLARERVDAHRLMRLLQAVADPGIGNRIRRSTAMGLVQNDPTEPVMYLLPPSALVATVARDLRRLSRQLNSVWSRSLLFSHPNAIDAARLAQSMDRQAAVLETVPWKRLNKAMGYKAFWKHFPLAMLCAILKVPEQCSYNELGQLIGVALRAYEASDTEGFNSPEALRKRIERFRKTNQGKILNSPAFEYFVRLIVLEN